MNGPWCGAAQGNHWTPNGAIHHWYTKMNSGETIPVTVEEVKRHPELATKGLPKTP